MSDTEARDKLVCAEEDALVERIARILFLDDMQPDTAQTGNRLWRRLCEQTNHNSEWHHTARRVIDGLVQQGWTPPNIAVIEDHVATDRAPRVRQIYEEDM